MTNQHSICPKCGCQIYDPFRWGKVIHDVVSCRGLTQLPPTQNLDPTEISETISAERHQHAGRNAA